MPVNYRFNNGGAVDTDFDDFFIRKDIFSAGGLYGWGNGSSGQIGDGTTVNKSSPVQVGSFANWKQISTGSAHSGAIKHDGTLWLWGFNFGRLGNNSNAGFSSPVQTAAGGNNWYQIACGGNGSAAIKTDGTLWIWGDNEYGQLGLNDLVNRSSPVQVGSSADWKQVSMSPPAVSPNSNFVGAVKTDGTLWTWGYSTLGSLGLGDSISRSSPTQVGSSTNWKQVSVGSVFAGAIKTDNTLWMWGTGFDGQLGINLSGAAANRSSPTQVGSSTNWKQIACGQSYTGAIKTDGSLWMWGLNTSGKLGDNSVSSRSSPVQIGSLLNWKQLAINAVHSVAVKADGTLWAWGQNTDGQLGTGIGTWTSSPVQIGSQTYWKQASIGSNFTIGISNVF